MNHHDNPAQTHRTGRGGAEDHQTKSKAELDRYLSYGGFGRVEREAMVWPGRKFRADWFLPQQPRPTVIEYDGLMFGGASHTSIANILRDAEKSNLAQAEGMNFYRVNAKTIQSGEAFTFLDRVLVKIEGDEAA
jgi:hypothetical protein